MYLVELKTTTSSISKKQAEQYVKNCVGKKFGEVLGKMLLGIVQEAFGKRYEEEFCEKFGKEPAAWNDQTLLEAYQLVFQKEHLVKPSYGMSVPQSSKAYDQAAKDLILQAKWTQSDHTRSRKYLYTLGNILKNHCGEKDLWEKDLRLIYLTPYGKPPHKLLTGKECENISLQESIKYLEKQAGERARLLAGIFQKIYGRD